MKTKILIVTVLVNFALVLNLNAQVAINTDNTTAASSAMLDVKSTSKGVLIPRMTTAQRTAISSPANGLLVYDETTLSFWFYDSSNSGWAELVSSPTINDLSDGINTAYSIFLGTEAGINDNANGNYNSGFGFRSLQNNISGTNNTALGSYSSNSNVTGTDNTSVGISANGLNVAGNNNTAVGAFAGQASSNSGCVFLGNQAGKNNASDNKLYIDNSSTISPLIGGDFSTNQVDINGTIKITGGTPGAGKVLTSDANGLASWTTPTTYANSIDDLSDGINDGSSVFIGNSSGSQDDGLNYNTALGNGASSSITSGTNNATLGRYANANNLTGCNNTAIGSYAGRGPVGNSSVSGCVFIGYMAGVNNTSDNKLYIDNSVTSTPLIGGDFSTNQIDINGTIKITGGTPGAGKVLTSDANGLASWTTPTTYANSIDDLSDGIYGGYSLFLGANAGGNDDASNNFNVGIGVNSLIVNTSGYDNTAIGYNALFSNQTGNWNTSIGTEALKENTDSKNTAIGYHSLNQNTSGTGNTAVGYNTLNANTTGDYNTAIGYSAFGSGTYSNSTAIGYGASISGNNQIHLGNTSITEIKGQVSFTQYSDARVKIQVQENVPGLDFITQLRPVTYYFDIEKENQIMGINQTASTDHSEVDSIRFTGFIAQEVETAANNVNYNFSGVKTPKNDKELYGLSYSEFVVPLVKAVQEQQEIINAQQKAIIALDKRLAELEVNQSNALR
ncbi:MAG: tail fiber domain-containing protein [Saprospiraceae bacterium]|nr:tail fiber domain-containing protein [Saprospiraceae bacterium]